MLQRHGDRQAARFGDAEPANARTGIDREDTSGVAVGFCCQKCLEDCAATRVKRPKPGPPAGRCAGREMWWASAERRGALKRSHGFPTSATVPATSRPELAHNRFAPRASAVPA